MRVLKLAALAAGLIWAALSAQAAELIMIEEDGCVYCMAWNQEIGPAYSKTAEGKFAPLRRIHIDEIPDDLDLAQHAAFTPTFILVENGKELARLEGYPGDNWFWPILTEMLKQHTGFVPEGS